MYFSIKPDTRSIWVKIRMLILIFLSLFLMEESIAQENKLPVSFEKNTLIYSPDSLGNRIPDFSYAGYKGGNESIPFIEAKIFIPHTNQDITATLQAAINKLSKKPLNKNGFRGAILLDKGTFNCKGRLVISHSGIVLHGSGFGKDGTTLIADGTSRETLIKIKGGNNKEVGAEINIIDDYVPVNSMQFSVEDGHALKVGDAIQIRRPSSKEWIDKLNMNEFGGEETNWLGWKPGRRDLFWDRTITQIEGNIFTIDAPLTTALDAKFGGGKIAKSNWSDRIENIGIENLNLVSAYDHSNLKDEDHCWMAITLENAKNVWVRQVSFKHFAGSAVAIYETAKKVTVEDCISTDPVSEIGGQRRYTFFTQGQQSLFQRCYAENGYHDFAIGYAATGPNVFLQCESSLPYSFSGTIDCWASGVLYDIVNVDGHALGFQNLKVEKQGAGYTAANSMLWQCSAAKVYCEAPPTAQNWAYGIWARFEGNGFWHEPNSHISPRSLYVQQLKERIGRDLGKELLPVSSGATSSPTVEEAMKYAAHSKQPPKLLKDFIMEAGKRTPMKLDSSNAEIFDIISFSEVTKNKVSPIEISNGWVTQNNEILTGIRMGNQWWRGNTRPDFISKSSPHITRFVPGREGLGFTDNQDKTISFMNKQDIVAFDHNYGLWYDRRRDDHERVRRMNGEVCPPFYELPFARSGQGTAWDGLSKYDLTQFNPWYWNRLKAFADCAELEGKFLIHENYFQHNILEAGAHWADFPWRSANNINNTGFPEPPPYAGDKRIFMAELFYDISHSVRRELHRDYIRQCLNNFADNSNVIQMISEEFTGPLHFVEFWVDVIIEWEKETGRNVLTGLSTTKDVQDAILANPERAKAIDVIDIKYWNYREDGTLYAPEGGKNMAPRQHARKVKVGKSNFQAIYRAVSEYKTKYPDKAVLYSGNGYRQHEWAVFMAGGSLAAIPIIEQIGFYKGVATMTPMGNGKNTGNILTGKDGYLVYLEKDQKTSIKLDNFRYNIYLINPIDGKTLETKEVSNIEKFEVKALKNMDTVIWITKK